MEVCRCVGRGIVILWLLLIGPGMALAGERPWAVTAYGVVLSSDPIEDLAVLDADFESDYQLAVLALSRRFEESFQRLDLEGEVQLAKHIKGQDHWEFNALVAARWLPFPWDDWVDTSLAFGAGISLASEVPPFERESHDDANDLLGYLLAELEMRPPGSDQLSFVLRLHHRSGGFGSFDGVYGASNGLGLGLKYRF